MNITVVDCPIVKRAPRDANNKYTSAAFDVVADGLVRLDDERLTVYKRQDYRRNGIRAESMLIVSYADVDNVVGKLIVSEMRTYRAGRLQFWGTFEEPRGYERITLKLHPDNYSIVKSHLKTYIGADGADE
jgi:hypothetical protein